MEEKFMKNFKGSFSLMRDKPFKKLFNDKEIFSDFMKSAYEFLNIDDGFHLPVMPFSAAQSTASW